MRMFEASVQTVILRFYLMMAVVIGSFFAGVPWLALLSLPILLSAMLGVSFKGKQGATIKASEDTRQKAVRVTETQQAA